MAAALQSILCFVFLSGAEARPSRYDCNAAGWFRGKSFGHMNAAALEEDATKCSMSGIPTEYSTSTSYTITVQHGGLQLANKLVVSAGTLTSGGSSSSPTCRSMDSKVTTQQYTWMSPSAGSGAVTIKALCGNYNNVYLTASSANERASGPSTPVFSPVSFPGSSADHFESFLPLLNGGFEYPAVTSHMSASPNSWTTQETRLIPQNNPSYGGLNSYSGNQYMGLKKFGAFAKQTVSVTPGMSYKISFLYATRPSFPKCTLSVKVGGSTLFTGTPSDTEFLAKSVTFTASGPTASIEFHNTFGTVADDSCCFVDYVTLQVNFEYKGETCSSHPITKRTCSCHPRWHVADADDTCKTACEKIDYRCTEEALHLLNPQVDTLAEMNQVLNSLGWPSLPNCEPKLERILAVFFYKKLDCNAAISYQTDVWKWFYIFVQIVVAVIAPTLELEGRFLKCSGAKHRHLSSVLAQQQIGCSALLNVTKYQCKIKIVIAFVPVSRLEMEAVRKQCMTTFSRFCFSRLMLLTCMTANKCHHVKYCGCLISVHQSKAGQENIIGGVKELKTAIKDLEQRLKKDAQDHYNKLAKLIVMVSDDVGDQARKTPRSVLIVPGDDWSEEWNGILGKLKWCVKKAGEKMDLVRRYTVYILDETPMLIKGAQRRVLHKTTVGFPGETLAAIAPVLKYMSYVVLLAKIGAEIAGMNTLVRIIPDDFGGTAEDYKDLAEMLGRMEKDMKAMETDTTEGKNIRTKLEDKEEAEVRKQGYYRIAKILEQRIDELNEEREKGNIVVVWDKTQETWFWVSREGFSQLKDDRYVKASVGDQVAPIAVDKKIADDIIDTPVKSQCCVMM
eukprot:jgi/Bigna1/82670/fgenesh1_pg.95_\